MPDVTEMSRDKLEHQGLQSQINEFKSQMHSGFGLIEAKLNLIFDKTNDIDEKITLTNSRVSKLELDTDFIAVFKRNKGMFLITVIGVITIWRALDIDSLINKFL